MPLQLFTGPDCFREARVLSSLGSSLLAGRGAIARRLTRTLSDKEAAFYIKRSSYDHLTLSLTLSEADQG